MQENMYSYEHAQNLVLDLERVLSGVGVPIRSGGALEAATLNVISLYEQYLNPSLRPGGKEDIRQFHRDFLGATDLACKIIGASSHADFGNLRSHLQLLNDAHPVQNSATNSLNQDNNKIFELFVACLCMMAGAGDVELDDPNSSDGNNPDVLATFDGVKWGFACKAMHSRKGMTIYENIKKAVEQIQRSPAQIGLPVLNAKNIILHDLSWQMLDDPEAPGEVMYLAHADTSQPIQILSEVAESIKMSVSEAAGDELFDLYADNDKCIPAYLLHLPTTSTTWIEGKPVTTRLNMFNLIQLGPMPPKVWSTLDLLNNQLQKM